MKTQYFNDMDELPDLGVCPICGTKLARMWGNGWDYDRAICPARKCDYDIELTEMTGTDPDGRIWHNIFEPEDFEE